MQRLALLIALATAAILTIGLGPPATAHAEVPLAPLEGGPPSPLIDANLQSGLYAADSFAQEALKELEQEAIADTLSAHDLPDTEAEADAVQTWGRDAALGQLWLLLVNAVNTPVAERTGTQEDAVRWLTEVMRRHDTVAADDAGVEYAKWAGLGASAFEHEIANNASESQLQSFLSQTPVNYGPGYLEHQYPEGYCVYISPKEPSPYSANIYSGKGIAPSTCYEACTSFLGCPAPTPHEEEFAEWGEQDALEDISGDTTSGSTALADTAAAVSEALGYSAASVAVGEGSGSASAVNKAVQYGALAAATDLFATIGTTIVYDVAAGAGLTAETLEGIVGGLSAASGGAALGAVVGLAVVAFINIVRETEAYQLPEQLVKLITDAPNASVDLAGELDMLYTLFIGSTLPDPSLAPCNPLVELHCLNPTEIPTPSDSDPLFTITGESSSTTSRTLTWKDSAQETTNEAYVSGDWFVHSETDSKGATTTYQTPDIRYTNWEGKERLAWITGDALNGYQFVTVEPDSEEAVNPQTCLGEGKCSEDSSLEYIGTDGDDYTVTPPAATVIPPIPECLRGEACFSGGTISIAASPSAAETGEPVTLMVTHGQYCTNIYCEGAGSTGTIEVDDIEGSTSTTVCTAVPLEQPSGTAECTWTPSSAGTDELYAIFTPRFEEEEDGWRAEVTVPVGTSWLTSTTVRASTSTPALGADLTYTATVSDDYTSDSEKDQEDGIVSGGTVSFLSGSTVLCQAPATAAGLVGGHFTYTASCSTSYDQAGPQKVTATYAPDGRHAGSSGSVEVSVAPGPTTIDISAPAEVGVDSPLWFSLDISAPGVSSDSIDGTATITGSLGGTCTVTISYGSGSCETSYPFYGQPVFDVSYAEPYDNGATATAATTVTVKSTVGVTVSGSEVYGSGAPKLAYTGDTPYDDAFAGTVTCTALSGGESLDSSLAVGSYSLEGSTCGGLSLTGLDSSLFLLSYAGAGAGFVVTPAPLTIAASDATMTYGGKVPAVSPSYEGFVNGDKPSSLTSAPSCSAQVTSGSPVGAYPTRCSGAVDGNYQITSVDGTVQVTPASLTVIAPSATMTYGGTAPKLTPIYSGFVNGDTASSLATAPSCSAQVTSGSPVGTYPTRCSGALDGNYQITSVEGTVQVTPAPLTVIASDATMTYGGSVPAVTPSYEGFVNGETASSLATAPSCSAQVTSGSPVGAYPTRCSGAAGGDYQITNVRGTVQVTPAPLTIAAPSVTMTYGGKVPALSPSYEGFVNGDTASSLTSAPSCSTTATSHSSPGTYPIRCRGAVDGDYQITYLEGTVKVARAPLRITAPSATMTYGGRVPKLTPTYSGLVNGDKASSLKTAPSCSTTATSGSSPGSYPIRCRGAVDGDYHITYVAGTVKVAPAPLRITAPSATMTYGETVPTLSPSYVGFVDGDTASSLTTAPTCSTTATSGSRPGIYPIRCRGAVDGDYAIAYSSGELTVLPLHPARPRVTRLTPSSGRRSGTTVVLIGGSSLLGATEVRFGSRRATFKVISARRIRAILPRGRGAGTVRVSVTTVAGTSPRTRSDKFTYVHRRRSGR